MSQNRASTRQRVYAQGYHRAIDRLLTSKIRSVRCINRDESSEDGARAMIVEDSTRTAVVFFTLHYTTAVSLCSPGTAK